MLHKMNLASEPFEQMASGNKTIALRLYDEKRKKIKVGELIEFTNLSNHKQLLAKVRVLHIYNSFAELYNNLSLIKCGYTKENIQYAKSEDML